MGFNLKEYTDTKKSLFGFLFFNITLGLLPLFMFVGFLSLIGYVPVMLNDQPVFGFLGLLLLILYAPIFSFVSTCFLWVNIKIGSFIIKKLF